MGKNVKKVISLVLVFAMILTGMTFTGFDAKAADAANDTSATAEYEIYPTPRSVVYQDSSFTLADKTNVVYDSTIDEATQKRLNEVLAIQNITGTVTGAVASNGMNVLVGTKGSSGRQTGRDQTDGAGRTGFQVPFCMGNSSVYAQCYHSLHL